MDVSRPGRREEDPVDGAERGHGDEHGYDPRHAAVQAVGERLRKGRLLGENRT